MKEKISPVTLTLTETAYTRGQLVDAPTPQIALAGRSNVGKSTLVNCLAGRKQLAKTSGSPGKTRSINYYLTTPGGYYLVDLPGYGYARCSKTERDKWAKLIDDYLRGNSRLRAVVSIIDCRHNPQEIDLGLQAYVKDLGLNLILVLTKADKCKRRERDARVRQWASMVESLAPPVLFSGKTGMGRDALMRVLDAAALNDGT